MNVKKAKYDWSICDKCESKEDVFDIEVDQYYSEAPTLFRLCRKCLVDLECKINHALKHD